MVITATIRFPHFKQSVVRSIGSSRFYRKPENRNVVPLVRYTNRRRSARKRPFILPKETKAGWPDYTSEARAAGTRPRRSQASTWPGSRMSNRSPDLGHPTPVGAPSRLSLGLDGTKQVHLSRTINLGLAKRVRLPRRSPTGEGGLFGASYGSASQTFPCRKADAVLARNQNIENNPMQSNKGSLAWML
jgi:hypothetical protein